MLALELKTELQLWLWHRTEIDKVAEERIDFVVWRQCTVGGELVRFALWVKMTILNHMRHSTGSQWSFSSKAEDQGKKMWER